MKEITIEQVKPEAERVSQFVAGISTKHIRARNFILVHETGMFLGWIFRQYTKDGHNPYYGHSGTHKTRTMACYKLLACDPSAQLFEFDTELERTEWLQSQFSQP